ncbi:MAG: carboxypeptidase-like regulatory domain-containing protein [Bacteroidales bacterium]|nr:carboxypeptidase-like regulatory domain-containing protein [Bacteroidales bacterium]
MIKKTIVTILFIIGILVNSYAQNDTIVIVGRVVDANSDPVENVNIQNLSNKTGTTSNSNGFFYATADDFPVDLRISRIGFDTKYLSLTKNEFESIEDFITIQLSAKVYTLEEVEIINVKPDVILSNQANRIILDFKIFEESILVLLKIGQRRMLKVFNIETITSFEISLSIRGDELFEDCMGNMHILTCDSVFQLETNLADSSISYYGAYSIDKFNSSLATCVGYINRDFIFKSVFNHNQEIRYWYIKDKKRVEFYHIYDKERELFAQNFLDRRNELIRQYGVIDEMGETSVSQLKIERKIKQLELGYQFIGRIPAYNPLFIYFETILIFDNLHNRIVFFDSTFSFQKEVAFLYKTNNSQRVFQDKATGRFYIEGFSSVNNVFYEIELNTGRTIKTIKIDHSMFPEKVCFYRNKIYFVDDDFGGIKSLKTFTID